MRDGYPMPKASGAKTFTGEKAVGHQRAAQAMQILKKQARFFKRALFAGDVNLRKYLRRGKDGR
jgi:hypothetical protein